MKNKFRVVVAAFLVVLGAALTVVRGYQWGWCWGVLQAALTLVLVAAWLRAGKQSAAA